MTGSPRSARSSPRCSSPIWNRKTGHLPPQDRVSLATRLAHFGRHLTTTDPGLVSFNQLDRRRHIEPYLNHVAAVTSTITGEPVTVADQDRRIRAVEHMFSEITEWGWDDAPPRRLIFRSDHPRLPRPLPRYVPVDADRRLAITLEDSDYRLAADALLLARAVGLRIGELLDLELDCVHEIAGNGSWLKVPLGKLDTERMVPLDDETVDLLDRIARTRTPGRALPHPRTRRPTQFLFTHHGRRLSQTAVRKELARAADDRRDRTRHPTPTPPHLRHRARQRRRLAASVDAAPRARLSRDEPALRPPVRLTPSEPNTNERSNSPRPASARSRHPRTRSPSPQPAAAHHDDDWRDAPAIKARLAGGHCLRAPAQGACPYANICEHCPSFRTDPTSLAVLAAQRVDTEALTARRRTTRMDRRSRPPPPPPHPPRHPHRASRMTTPHTTSKRSANDSPTTADRSRSPPSPPPPGSAAPPSTATANCAPSSKNTATTATTPAPSPASPPRSTTSAPHSTHSPTASATKKNDSDDSNNPRRRTG